jgi:hypothetical protein
MPYSKKCVASSNQDFEKKQSSGWEGLFRSVGDMPQDFMQDRNDLPPQEREPF